MYYSFYGQFTFTHLCKLLEFLSIVKNDPLGSCNSGCSDKIGLHYIRIAQEMYWSILENGELLGVAEKSGFEIFVTTDRNLKYQKTYLFEKLYFGSFNRHHVI